MLMGTVLPRLLPPASVTVSVRLIWACAELMNIVAIMIVNTVRIIFLSIPLSPQDDTVRLDSYKYLRNIAIEDNYSLVGFVHVLGSVFVEGFDVRCLIIAAVANIVVSASRLRTIGVRLMPQGV